MDSMIQILEGIEVEQASCPCRRNLAGATTTIDTWTTAGAAIARPAVPWLGVLALIAGGFAVDRLRRKK